MGAHMKQIPIVHLAVDGHISEQNFAVLLQVLLINHVHGFEYVSIQQDKHVKLCFHKVLFICRIFRAL